MPKHRSHSVEFSSSALSSPGIMPGRTVGRRTAHRRGNRRLLPRSPRPRAGGGSRLTIAWKLCTTMRAGDVTDTLDLALEAAELDTVAVTHRPGLLSDNGSSYISGDPAEWLADRRMRHVRGAPHHPMTQGKIERWHQTLKKRILLENYFLPGNPEAQVGAFVEHYNHRRYHKSLGNLTPADVYFGRDQAILQERERIKRQTIEHRRLLHRSAAA